MAKVQGTFYTAERLRRGTAPVSPPYLGEDGQPYPVNPPGSGNAPLTPPVAKTYASEAAMIADQASQLQGYLYFDGTDNWWYKGTVVGDITDYQAFGSGSGSAPVAATYANQAAMIAAQGSQVANYFYFDSVRYWEYLGTTAGTIADYRKAVFGVSPYDLAQAGASDGDVLTWVAANSRYEPSASGASKWTSVTNGIYRNGRVVIGDTSVSTNQTFKVTGSGVSALIRSTNSAAFLASRVTTQNYPGTGIAGSFSNYGEYSSITDGAGVGFSLAVVTASDPITNFTGLSVIGSYLRSSASNQSDLVIFLRNGSSTLLENFHLRYDGALVIGHASGNPTFGAFLDVRGSIKSDSFTGSTARAWRFGERKAATVAFDTTQYVTVQINGTIYNLALAV